MTVYFVSNAGSNTAPYDTEAKAATTLGVIAALPWTNADTVKVSSTHSETAGAAITYTLPTSPGLKIISVLFNGSGTGGWTAGGAISVGAASAALAIPSGFADIEGLSLQSGTNNNGSCDLTIAGGTLSTGIYFDTCTLIIPTINTGGVLIVGATTSANNDDCIVSMRNCVISKGNASSVSIGHGRIRMAGLTLAGSVTTIFSPLAGGVTDLVVSASDLSGVAWTNIANAAIANSGLIQVVGCKLASGFALTTGTFAGPGSIVVEVIDSNSGDVNYYYAKACWQGTVIADNTIYAGATDGTNSISWLMTGNANSSFTWPLVSPPIGFFNSTLGAMTTTIQVTNDGTTYTNAQLWQETLAKITSGFPLGTWNLADRVANILATPANQDSSTQSWTGTGGFGAEVKQQLVSGSFTPAEVGEITAVVYLAANDTVYVSPKVLAASSKQWMTLAGIYMNEAPPATAAKVIGGYYG